MQSLTSKQLLRKLKFDLKNQVASLIDSGTDPHLAAVLVGDDESSLNYIDIKTRVGKEVGVIVSLYHIEESASLDEIKETIAFLSQDDEIHGIILQLPLPEKFSQENVDELIAKIPASKDVDGLRGDWKKLTYTSYSTESLLGNQPYALPPMVGSVTSLLNEYDISLDSKRVVLVGNGRLVGQPLSEFYGSLGINVQAVDETTPNIFAITSEADILVTGTGVPNLVTYQWVKPGATVIDCSGDVHEDSVSQVAEALSPAIGGVGPLTVFWLLHNTYQAARNLT